MSIINCFLIVFNDKPPDRMVLRTFPCSTKRGNLQVGTRRELGAAQVLASLLVSVLMVGFKLNSAKEIVQIIERRQELQMNLSMVRRLLEIENTKAWIKDVAHDTKQREDRIAELESASGHVYGLLEDALVEFQPAQFPVDVKFGIRKIHRKPASFPPSNGKDKRKARRPLPCREPVVGCGA